MTALIRFLRGGPEEGPERTLRPGVELLLGSDRSCDLRLRGRGVAKVHATLLVEDGQLQIEADERDITVGGRRCRQACLRVGDEVGLGTARFLVEHVAVDDRRQTVVPELDGLPVLSDAALYHDLTRCMLAIQALIAGDGPDLVAASLEMVFLALPVTRLALFVVTADGSVLQGFTKIDGPRGPQRSRLSHGLARNVLAAGRAILLSEVGDDDIARHGPTLAEQEVCSVIGVPVRLDDHIAAVVIGDNLDRPGALNQDHVRMLEFIALALGYVFQRDDLRRLRRRQRETERQFSAARLIQQRICAEAPSTVQVEDLRWAAACRPALELGGDYHDAVHDGQQQRWVIADVSGKGTPAALVVSMLRAFCKTLHPHGLAAHEFLLQLDRLLSGELPEGMFVTAAVAEIDDHHLRWCAVGHPAPLVLGADGAVALASVVPGTLGLSARPLDPRSLSTHEVAFAAGDRLCLVTDGLVEAADSDGREFDLEGVARCLKEVTGREESAQVAAVIEAALGHANGDQADDMTIIIAHRIVDSDRQE